MQMLRLETRLRGPVMDGTCELMRAGTESPELFGDGQAEVEILQEHRNMKSNIPCRLVSNGAL